MEEPSSVGRMWCSRLWADDYTVSVNSCVDLNWKRLRYLHRKRQREKWRHFSKQKRLKQVRKLHENECSQ